jgi:hypothetical protein
MTTTAEFITISGSSQPPRQPGGVRSHGPADFIPSGDTPAHQGSGLPEQQQPTPLPAPEPPAVSIIVDVNGQFVAEDRLGAAHGVGPTPQAAMSDFYDALSRRLSLLRRHRDELHAGLRLELSALERLFPSQ